MGFNSVFKGLTNFLAGVYKPHETECTMAPNICGYAVSNLLYFSCYGAWKLEVVPKFFFFFGGGVEFVHPCFIQSLLTILLGTDRARSAYRFGYRVR